VGYFLICVVKMVRDVKVVKYTRVPIVKFVVDCADINSSLLSSPLSSSSSSSLLPSYRQCDLYLNRSFGVHNSDLLRVYSECDSRVRPLVMLIKIWAKNRGIGEAYNGALSMCVVCL
jgi:DNA polymerase sigma